MVTHEAMTPHYGRPMVQILVVRMDIGVVIYEAMTSQCGRSVVQVIVVRVDIRDVPVSEWTRKIRDPDVKGSDPSSKNVIW